MSVGARGDNESTVNSGASLSEDDVFEVLSNQRRRFTLHYLMRNEKTIEVGELADQVAAWENNISAEDVTANQRKRAYTALQQNHLPQMDRAGIVDYDHPRGTIEMTDSAEEIDIYLDVVYGRDIPWNKYYLGLSGVGLAIMIAAWANYFPIPVSDAACGLFLAVALAFSAVIHHLHTEQLGVDELPPEVDGETTKSE